ncbi:MAG: sugar-binding protein [Spirochaetota bacterium]
MERTIRIITLTMCAAAVLSAKNLIKNSSFETGLEGYGVQRAVPAAKEAADIPFALPRIDSNESVHGRASVRLECVNGSGVKVIMKEVALEGGKRYTFSIRMKASRPNTKVVLDLRSAEEENIYNGTERSCLVGTAWADYSLSHAVPKGRKYYHIQLHCNTSVRTALDADTTLWLDAVQMDEGESTLYVPPALELGISRTRARAYTLSANEAYPVRAVVRNNGTAPVSAKISYRVVDDYFGRTVKTSEALVNAGADASTVEMIDNVSPMKRGKYTLTAELIVNGSVADTSVLDLAVIDSVKTSAFTDGYAVAGQGFPHAVNLGVGFKDRPLFVLFGNTVSDWFDFYAEGGHRIVRDWGGSDNDMLLWRHIEPEEGKYDWAMADRFLEESMKRGMKVMPTLGGWWWIREPAKGWEPEYFPEWAIPRMKFGVGANAAEAAKGARMCLTPPEELTEWQRFVKACVARYKGRITHWEILNEPNVNISPEYYTAYLAMMNRIIKETDPNARVVGFCATGDLGGNIGKFLEECFKLGALTHCDVVSYHAYGAPLDWSAPMSAEANNAGIRALVNKYGGEKKEIWNSELYYLGKPTKNDFYLQPLIKGHELARRYLIDAASGVGKSFTIPCGYLKKSELAPNYWHSSDFLSGDLIPSHLFVINNTLAREFTGIRFTKQITTSGRTKLYLYERAAGPIAAAWSYDPGNKPFIMTFPKAAGKVRLINIMGNTIDVPGGSDIVMDIDNTPFYIVPASIDKSAFTALLESVTVRGKNPLELFAQYSFRGASPALAFEVKNTAPEDVSCFINARVRGDAVTLPVSGKEKIIPALSAKTFFLPLEAKSEWSRASILLQAEVGDRIYDFPATIYPKPSRMCTALSTPITVDGTLTTAEWANTARVILDRREQIKEGDASSWSGADEFSGVISVVYDADALYIGMNVKKAGGRGERRDRDAAWDGDALELFIDTDPDAMLDTPTFTKHCFQMLFGLPTPKHPGIFCMKRGMTDKQIDPASITHATAENASGYSLEVRIPWGEINGARLSGGGVMGFDAGIDNNTSGQRKWQMLWCGKNDNYKNRMNYGRLILQ